MKTPVKTRLLILPLLLALNACAPTPTADRLEGSWRVMSGGKDDKKLCFAASSPIAQAGTFGGERGQPYLMVTRRASGKMEVSASSGYAYMRNSLVELAVDGAKPVTLLHKDATAWARHDADDRALLHALSHGGRAELRGVTQEADTTIDTYSLAGLGKAVARVKELCP